MAAGTAVIFWSLQEVTIATTCHTTDDAILTRCMVDSHFRCCWHWHYGSWNIRECAPVIEIQRWRQYQSLFCWFCFEHANVLNGLALKRMVNLKYLSYFCYLTLSLSDHIYETITAINTWLTQAAGALSHLRGGNKLVTIATILDTKFHYLLARGLRSRCCDRGGTYRNTGMLMHFNCSCKSHHRIKIYLSLHHTILI